MAVAGSLFLTLWTVFRYLTTVRSGYYAFSDNEDYIWYGAMIESNKLKRLCP